MKIPAWVLWLRDSPWLFVVIGAFLALVSVTSQVELWGTTFRFAEDVPLRLLGYAGVILLSLGIALVTMTLIRRSPIRARALLGPSAIYVEARRMVERCTGDETILATSISTKLPNGDESSHADVAAYSRALASKCAEAKRNEKGLIYKTVFGFAHGTNGEPPDHKKISITERRTQFKGVEDRLVMKYLETDWSLDVLIVGSREMLIAFPTLPSDRKVYLGLKVENADFVSKAIRWYEECVLPEAKDVTWEPDATVPSVVVPPVAPSPTSGEPGTSEHPLPITRT